MLHPFDELHALAPAVPKPEENRKESALVWFAIGLLAASVFALSRKQERLGDELLFGDESDDEDEELEHDMLFTERRNPVQACHEEYAALDKSNPVPPATVAAEAKQGLKLRASVAPSRRGGTAVGIARAKQLSSRQNISDSTVKRMKSFFARHEVDKKAKGFRRGEVGYPSKGLQAWKLWGGDSGKAWANKMAKKSKR
jgi:hypothetical protein